MKTNKPEVKIYEPSEKGATIMRKASFRNTGPDRYVLLSDYERLQAELQKLRKDAERYRWLRADALSAYEDDLDEPQLVYARECVGDYQDCIDAAIDKAIAGDQP